MLEKYRSDIYACHRCGLCRAKYSDEVRYVCPIREHTGGFEYSFARGRIQIAKGILENRLPYSGSLVDVIYKCLLCGNCRELCGKKDPVTGTWIIDHTAIFKAIREDIVSLGLMPHVHKKIDSSIKKHYELYKEPHVNRLKWAEGMKIPENAEVMLFVGCISSYKSREIAKAAANILKTAGITFGILKDEWCCGMKVLNAGSCNSGKKVAKHNVTALRKAGAKTVIMQCGECYKGFKIDYPEMIGELPFEVLHITQFIKKLINEGKINLTEQIRKKVTYHDPCALGRFSGVYDEPREILKMIPGTELVEMYPAKEYAWCCGGSIKDAYPDLAVKIAVDRVNHAHEVGAEVLTSACPLCKINIQDAIKKTDTDLVFYDIIEIIAKAAGL